MQPASSTPEQAILRARKDGSLSRDESFHRLYELYARDVLAWIRFHLRNGEAEDLFQDVWATFYTRWREWQFPEHLESAEARPVISFLYRTAAFVLRGHRRRARFRKHEPLDGLEPADALNDPAKLITQLDYERCLDLAAEFCIPEELDVLMGKLSGLSAAEIAAALRITPAVVDHRYRNVLARLRQELAPPAPGASQEDTRHV